MRRTGAILLAGICISILPCTLWAQVGGAWESVAHTALRTGGGAAPGPRYRHTAVWTGTHLFVFGGQHNDGTQVFARNDGGIYDASVDIWISTPNLTAGALPSRMSAVGCWTGSLVLVWGGMTTSQAPTHSTGFAYSPATDTFAHKPNFSAGVGAPTGAHSGTAVWTGDRMLVYGGYRQVLVSATFDSWWAAGVFDGGMYDPVTDTWDLRPVLNSEVPPQQHNMGFVWVDDGLYSRGGAGGAHPVLWGQVFSAGRVYNPHSDVWNGSPALVSGALAPVRLEQHGAIWTGEWVVEFGGVTQPPVGSNEWHNDGLVYSVANDSFLPKSNLNGSIGAPPERIQVPSVWTGSHLWIWGGQRFDTTFVGNMDFRADGGLYDPSADVWTGTSNVSTPSFRSYYSAVTTGGSILGFGGFYKIFPNAPSGSGSISVIRDDGFVFHPPRVAPTVRNLNAAPSAGKPNGDVGATQGNPLKAKVGQPFKHRIVCYGTPEAALISLDKPSWLNIGWGGPGPLVAAGTGQGNGGVGGAPPGTGAPFHPWYSSNGSTADGQWLRGTPDAAATGLHSFTIHAHNGVFPDSQTYTVWIDVEGPPVWDDNSIISGPPETIARSGVDYSYFPQTIANPAATYSVSGLPSWATWVGFGFHGTPTAADEYTVSHITVTATNTHGNISRNYYLTVLPPKPLAPGTADVNSDGDVNVLDVQKTINILLALEPPSFIPHPTEPPPAQLMRGDIDGSGIVDVVDVQAIVNAVLGR